MTADPNNARYFGADYRDCRDRFVEACRSAGASVESFRHPLAGLDGGPLYTDVAQLGPVESQRCLVVISGTHGVEGLCGSGVQTGLLASGLLDELPTDASLLLVHGLNPFGFSWLRRTNEDGVDINRNFVDFAKPVPENPMFGRVAELLVPADDSLFEYDQRNQAALAAFSHEVGERTARDVISRGQFDFPTSIHYGGTAPSWSHVLIRTLMLERLAHCSDIVLIDIHTGLGPSGYGDLIVTHPAGSRSLQLARQWWGDRVSAMFDDGEVAYLVRGSVLDLPAELVPAATVVSAAIEFGTHDMTTVWNAIRRDQWLFSYGLPESAMGDRIRDEVRHAFYPDDPEWRRKVGYEAREVFRQAFRGMRTDQIDTRP